ncbi:atpase [hydrocarbon metagenome]|uniref:Atpase n=1 Tax=hydrocarbon metagenome TaxID=938273 RepID=A0A0W8E4K5_9ZZZZ
MYPGGNTRYGFYSLYDHMVLPRVKRKIILKGGPGVGKSTFMKKVGVFFAEKGFDIEYHWCSSDDNSLDGIVIGDHQVCILDGTAPHVVDPIWPGAVDEIINLGEYWDREQLTSARDTVIKLTRNIGRYFDLAYRRLQESGIAYDELKSYNSRSIDEKALSRNIQALASDFLGSETSSFEKTRHLFPGAITPSGLNTKIESLIPEDASLFAVKGSPGSGLKKLFKYVEGILELAGIYAEIFHNPFDPSEIDLIILPASRKALLDTSSNIFAYENRLQAPKYRRILDFDKFLDPLEIDIYAKTIAQSRDRMEDGIRDAVYFIESAKKAHDELELYYIPAMDFEAINTRREKLQEELLQEL